MADTVRVMPRQPIEAKRDEFGESYYTERGTSIVHRDYLNSGGVGWVEVSDPIVWDDTRESLQAIADALPEEYDCYEDQGFGRVVIVASDDPELHTISEIPYLNRIQIVGDSFAILPPEVTR